MGDSKQHKARLSGRGGDGSRVPVWPGRPDINRLHAGARSHLHLIHVEGGDPNRWLLFVSIALDGSKECRAGGWDTEIIFFILFI